MKSNEIRKELAEIAPELNKLLLREDRSVPEGYFETLPDITWNKIKNSNPSETRIKSIVPYRLLAGIAASVLVMISCLFLLNQQDVETEGLLVEDMVDYLIEEVDYVDTELLYELYFDSEDIAETETEFFDYLDEDGIQDLDETFLESLY